ncbi:hypothetical protein DESUT3_32720 [Desulfuromonas versatilis]|uniref:YheU family protein n=1 Tax=Desulfuromonas versatilis TaxID=2802975 RepID=A0ABN6E1G8_9BACT|nr:YheU family protein [Desulfuromonas versatilis]BCR06203.1 hypothetical protein DESUT3_32720 [Desulfuromonas versatilis]
MTQKNATDHNEEGIEVPHQELNPQTLRNLIREFVSRDGADWAEAGCSLEDKVAQVLAQLRSGQARVVFDLRSQTANIVSREASRR